jgi:hypothetical protein
MRFFLFGFSEPGGSKQGFKWASHRCRKKKVNEVLSISPDSSRFFHTSHGPGWTGPDLFRSTYGAARPNNTACRTNQNPGAGSAEAAPPWPLAFAATVSHATAADIPVAPRGDHSQAWFSYQFLPLNYIMQKEDSHHIKIPAYA